MRILVLSDIHGNLDALEACLASAERYDIVVNLGDIVGYGASPNEVTVRVRNLGGIFVRGNHDRVVAGIDTVENFNPIAGAAALWSRAQLTSENLDWLRDLPKGPVGTNELSAVQYVHGAPDNEDRYVVTPQDAAVQLMQTSMDVTFFGHTHIQGAFQLGGKFVRSVRPAYETVAKQEVWDLRLKEGVKYMINPGSLDSRVMATGGVGLRCLTRSSALSAFSACPTNCARHKKKFWLQVFRNGWPRDSQQDGK